MNHNDQIISYTQEIEHNRAIISCLGKMEQNNHVMMETRKLQGGIDFCERKVSELLRASVSSFAEGTHPLAQPDLTGKNKALVAEAKELVSSYNQKAAELAVIVEQLLSVREEIGDNQGVGTVIISPDGWQGNALEIIPMLRMHDGEFPSRTIRTGGGTVPQITRGNNFLDGRPDDTNRWLGR